MFLFSSILFKNFILVVYLTITLIWNEINILSYNFLTIVFRNGYKLQIFLWLFSETINASCQNHALNIKNWKYVHISNNETQNIILNTFNPSVFRSINYLFYNTDVKFFCHENSLTHTHALKKKCYLRLQRNLYIVL